MQGIPGLRIQGSGGFPLSTHGLPSPFALPPPLTLPPQLQFPDSVVTAPAAALLPLPARGGLELAVQGSDFGIPSDPNCVFLTWIGAGVTDPVCDGLESFVGEGEVWTGAILSYNDSVIRLTVPPTMGTLTVSIWAFNQKSTVNEGIRVNPPTLNAPASPLLFGKLLRRCWCWCADLVLPLMMRLHSGRTLCVRLLLTRVTHCPLPPPVCMPLYCPACVRRLTHALPLWTCACACAGTDGGDLFTLTGTNFGPPTVGPSTRFQVPRYKCATAPAPASLLSLLSLCGWLLSSCVTTPAPPQRCTN